MQHSICLLISSTQSHKRLIKRHENNYQLINYYQFLVCWSLTKTCRILRSCFKVVEWAFLLWTLRQKFTNSGIPGKQRWSDHVAWIHHVCKRHYFSDCGNIGSRHKFLCFQRKMLQGNVITVWEFSAGFRPAQRENNYTAESGIFKFIII